MGQGQGRGCSTRGHHQETGCLPSGCAFCCLHTHWSDPYRTHWSHASFTWLIQGRGPLEPRHDWPSSFWARSHRACYLLSKLCGDSGLEQSEVARLGPFSLHLRHHDWGPQCPALGPSPGHCRQWCPGLRKAWKTSHGLRGILQMQLSGVGPGQKQGGRGGGLSPALTSGFTRSCHTAPNVSSVAQGHPQPGPLCQSPGHHPPSASHLPAFLPTSPCLS